MSFFLWCWRLVFLSAHCFLVSNSFPILRSSRALFIYFIFIRYQDGESVVAIAQDLGHSPCLVLKKIMDVVYHIPSSSKYPVGGGKVQMRVHLHVRTIFIPFLLFVSCFFWCLSFPTFSTNLTRTHPVHLDVSKLLGNPSLVEDVGLRQQVRECLNSDLHYSVYSDHVKRYVFFPFLHLSRCVSNALIDSPVFTMSPDSILYPLTPPLPAVLLALNMNTFLRRS